MAKDAALTLARTSSADAGLIADQEMLDDSHAEIYKIITDQIQAQQVAA